MLVEDFLIRSAARLPEKTAVVCEDRRVSYRELDEMSSRLARALIDGGTQRGDRVAVFLDNSIEAAISIFGVLKAGCVFVVLNNTTKLDKLSFILDDCSARALITGQMQRETIEALKSRVISLGFVVLCGEHIDTSDPILRSVDFDTVTLSFPLSLPERRSIDIDLAALIYTSGSTGFPKGVAVSHLNVVSAARSITEFLRNVADDVIINVLPLSFDYGLYQLLMATMVGATLVLEKSFAFPFKTVQRIQDEHVTGFPGVPTVFALLMQMKDLDPGRFDGIRYVTNTAAALPPAHISRIQRLFKKAKVYSMYGLTECKRVSFLDPNEIGMRPTSVGKPMPNVDVSIVDDHGEPVPPGVVGELVVRGSNVMMGYWNRPEETAAIVRSGRFAWENELFTGDLFKQDDQGFLYFVSRKDDIIKSRGEKVSPTEVERVIQELPEVSEAVVTGATDPILGQAVKAIVVRTEDSDVTEKDIIRHCMSRLENFMVPREVEFADVLPKTATGKVRRKALRES